MARTQSKLKSVTLTEALITTGALPASKKIFVASERDPNVKVALREVALSGGEPSVRLYDTSGPYTDPAARIDIYKGLAPLRRDWILARGDVEEYAGRVRKPEDDGLKPGEKLSVEVFDRTHLKPLRAKPGRPIR